MSMDSSTVGTCRNCGVALRHTFVDLGMSPLCETYLTRDQLNSMEPFFPLHVFVCDQCWLVQLQEYVSPDNIFSEYAYFSSFSDSWLQHARAYVEMISKRLALRTEEQVVEIASNDGYLLQHFVARGQNVLGVEPAANIARVAEEKGVPTHVAFFGCETATRLVSQGRRARLLLGNNVLAHVPDLHDFVGGMKILLADDGVITMEFPHLQRLIEGNQFDTIYHEHFSYLSLLAVENVFRRHNLRVFDVEELSTHGGSLRIYATHAQNQTEPDSSRVTELRRRESALGFATLAPYESFRQRVESTKHHLLRLLIDLKSQGHSIAGYGAPGKGNTLLNYCGIRTDLLEFVVDRNPYKHGRFLPGTHIPIFAPDEIKKRRPDYVLILPWNLQAEISHQLAYIGEWGGKLLVPIPEPAVLSGTPSPDSISTPQSESLSAV